MAVPFRDIAGDEPAAALAYLLFLEAGNGAAIKGALFVTNRRGDPLEFCFTRVNADTSVLWDSGRAYRRAVAVLVRALFEAANHQPDLVLALSEEIPPEVFTEDIDVQVPVCLVGDPGADVVPLHWIDGDPEAGSVLSGLVESLRSHDLLLEPFRRAAQGLEEAFTD